MYPEYKKVKTFLERAKNLEQTSMKMEDIFRLTMNDNSSNVAAIFVNDKGKIRKYRYSKYKKHCYQFAGVISNYLMQQEKNRPLVLKLANCPRWA